MTSQTQVCVGDRHCIDALRIRAALGRRVWSPPQPWGLDTWVMVAAGGDEWVLVSIAEFDGVPWLHASITRRGRLPSYDDLVMLHRAVWGDGYAYQAFVPADRHVNFHQHCLHLWGRADGAPVLPTFADGGLV